MSASPSPFHSTDEKPAYFCEKSTTDTYTLISTIAFLIGVPQHTFENEHEPPQLETYNKLKYDKNACIIRNLCMLRTAIIRNFKKINQEMYHNYRLLSSLDEYIPMSCLTELSACGIHILKKNTRLAQYIVDINKNISDRINNCKNLFPLWLDWNYVRDIFIMPNGLKEDGTKAASDLYYAERNNYPYQVYLNWVFFPGDGNILFNDKNLPLFCISGMKMNLRISIGFPMSITQSKTIFFIFWRKVRIPSLQLTVKTLTHMTCAPR